MRTAGWTIFTAILIASTHASAGGPPLPPPLPLPPPILPAPTPPGPVATNAAVSPEASDPNVPVAPVPPPVLPPITATTELVPDVLYGRPGVFELGGSAGLTLATGFRNVNFAPSFGWFPVENIELTGILGVSNIKAGSSSATVWSALVEPSYHLPLNATTYGFMGLGLGVAYVGDLGGGLAVAPRIGAKLRVGRAGLLSPSLSYEYTTHNVDTADNIMLVAVSSSLRVNIGYTTIW